MKNDLAHMGFAERKKIYYIIQTQAKVEICNVAFLRFTLGKNHPKKSQKNLLPKDLKPTINSSFHIEKLNFVSSIDIMDDLKQPISPL